MHGSCPCQGGTVIPATATFTASVASLIRAALPTSLAPSIVPTALAAGLASALAPSITPAVAPTVATAPQQGRRRSGSAAQHAQHRQTDARHRAVASYLRR